MKKKSIFMFMIALLAACHNGRQPVAGEKEDTVVDSVVNTVEEEIVAVQEYNPTDAESFGLNGNVQEVISQIYSTYDENGELKENFLEKTVEMRFNAWGKVTKDEWGNEYGYDADGNYYRGNHTYTTVKRDKAGRLIQYVDVEPNMDNQDNNTISFSYDKAGRLTVVTQQGWTGNSEEKREYDKGNSYPSRALIAESYEGGGTSNIVQEYRYSSFDEFGNWIVRVVVCSETITEMDEEGMDSTNVKSEIRIEKRSIVYY